MRPCTKMPEAKPSLSHGDETSVCSRVGPKQGLSEEVPSDPGRQCACFHFTAHMMDCFALWLHVTQSLLQHTHNPVMAVDGHARKREELLFSVVETCRSEVSLSQETTADHLSTHEPYRLPQANITAISTVMFTEGSSFNFFYA